MKRILIYTSALALMAGTISNAYAHDHGFRRGHSRVIIQQGGVQPAVGIGLAAILGLGLLSRQPSAAFVAEEQAPCDCEPTPRKKFRAPVEPKLRNPIPMK
jgi:hypothetical protein